MPSLGSDDINFTETSNTGQHRIEKVYSNENKLLNVTKFNQSKEIDLGQPSSRKDAEKLNEWLDFMVEK